MKIRIILPIVAIVTLLIYFLSSQSAQEESPQTPTPSKTEVTYEANKEQQPHEVTTKALTAAETSSPLPLLCYDPKKDPLYSQEAKQVYYDRLSAYYTWTQGKNLIPNILMRFSGDEKDVRLAISESKRFQVYAAVPYLKEIMQNPADPNFRLALGALIFFDEDAGYSYAIEQLHGDDQLQWTSPYLDAIINRNKTEYIDDLYEVVEKRGIVYRIIAGALSRMGEDILASEISRMRPVKNVPWQTLDALANTGEQEPVSFLKEHYEKSTNLGSRLYSAYALIQLGYPEYREPIVSSVLELGTIPPMDSDVFRSLVKEKGHITDYGISDMFLAMELLEKIEQPNALEILAQVATQTAETNSPISKHALALIAKDQSEESLEMLLELTESGVVPMSNFRAKLFALYQTDEAEQHVESVLDPWYIEKYHIIAETKGWRGFFRDPRIN